MASSRNSACASVASGPIVPIRKICPARLPKPPAISDPIFGYEPIAQLGFFHMGGRSDDCEVPNPVLAVFYQRFEAELNQFNHQLLPDDAVSFPTLAQALFLDNGQTLMHGVIERWRSECDGKT